LGLGAGTAPGREAAGREGGWETDAPAVHGAAALDLLPSDADEFSGGPGGPPPTPVTDPDHEPAGGPLADLAARLRALDRDLYAAKAARDRDRVATLRAQRGALVAAAAELAAGSATPAADAYQAAAAVTTPT